MGNEKSKVTGQSGDAKQTSVQPKGATPRLQRINMQRVQNVLLIWLDGKVDDNNADCRNTITQLRRAVNDVNTFIDEGECIQFIDNIINNNEQRKVKSNWSIWWRKTSICPTKRCNTTTTTNERAESTKCSPDLVGQQH